MDIFWKTWKPEYLTSLRERTQKEISSPKREEFISPRVILNKPKTLRGIWKLSRIKEHQGKDGKLWASTIELSNGKVPKLSISVLYPLEINDEIDSEIETTIGNSNFQ